MPCATPSARRGGPRTDAQRGRHRQPNRQDHRGRRGRAGYDGGKKISGRKRHIVVDTLGLLLAVVVTQAKLDDAAAAPLLFQHLTSDKLPRLEVI